MDILLTPTYQEFLDTIKKNFPTYYGTLQQCEDLVFVLIVNFGIKQRLRIKYNWLRVRKQRIKFAKQMR